MAYKIQSIQALRGIAAMLVVLGHMNVYLANNFNIIEISEFGKV